MSHYSTMYILNKAVGSIKYRGVARTVLPHKWRFVVFVLSELSSKRPTSLHNYVRWAGSSDRWGSFQVWRHLCAGGSWNRHEDINRIQLGKRELKQLLINDKLCSASLPLILTFIAFTHVRLVALALSREFTNSLSGRLLLSLLIFTDLLKLLAARLTHFHWPRRLSASGCQLAFFQPLLTQMNDCGRLLSASHLHFLIHLHDSIY